jgi:putative ABC transport system permease protein
MSKNGSPRLANLFLRLFLGREDFLEKSGDLEEVYRSLCEEYGRLRAQVWLWFQILTTLARLIMNSLCWRFEMMKNHLKIALRNMQRHRGFSFINIFGLSVGMACCLIIFLFIRDELNFEKFHKNSPRIYRTIVDEYVDGKWEHNVGSPDLLGPALEKELPEVLSSVRLFNPNWIDKWSVSFEKKYFYEDNLFFADATIFKVFTFPLLRGDPETALKDPNSIVITETMAQKYFGREDPMGKVLRIDDAVELKITGIAKNVPKNTHFCFDFLASFESMPYQWALNNWRTLQFYTYVLLNKEYDQNQLDEKLSPFLKKHFGQQTKTQLHLQPIEDIHLHSRFYNQDMAPNNSDISYVYIFSTIAIFILGIACINFMNLSTARSAQRAREVGIRKVIGAFRAQLIKQFLGESFLFSFIAAIVSVFLITLFLPTYNTLSGKDITFNAQNMVFIGGFLAFVIFIAGLISGSYPSLFFSSFQPAKILKGFLTAGQKGILFRRALVMFQFMLSVCLIIGTIIVYRQINYCLNKNLGFDEEHVVVIPLRSRSVQAKYESYRNALLQNPSVLNIAGSSTVPGRSVGERGMLPEGNKWYPRNSMFVDFDFIPTFGMEIKEGRNFSRDFPTDVDDAYIVNEAAVKNFGWEDPIGKRIIWAGDKNKKGFIIGVVKDFHYKSFHQKIEPLVLHMTPGIGSYASIRIKSENILNTMSFIKNKWQEFNPGHPFDYLFLDDQYDRLYRSEKKMGQVFRYFTFLALFISCLGLFGLSSYVLEKRTKEIGIRKILGASLSSIIIMVSKEFSKWIFLANVVAWPIVYFSMNLWLENFSYRINISFWTFLLSTVIVMALSLFTVSYQSVKAAMTNPANSLKYE